MRLPAGVVVQDPAIRATNASAEQCDAEHGTGVSWDLRVLRRLEQVAQCDANDKDQGERHVTGESPAEIGGEQRLPLGRVQIAVPGPGRRSNRISIRISSHERALLFQPIATLLIARAAVLTALRISG